jgi:hypothetical protein
MNEYFNFTFKELFVDESTVEVSQAIPMANMDEVASQILLYESQTNIRLRIHYSISCPPRREYRCQCHRGCTFKATFAQRAIDNQIVLKSANYYHIYVL